MALKDDWEISEIYAYKYKKDNTEVETKVTKAMLKKGSAISFPKTYKELNMTVVMTNGSKTITYDFSFGR